MSESEKAINLEKNKTKLNKQKKGKLQKRKK